MKPEYMFYLNCLKAMIYAQLAGFEKFDIIITDEQVERIKKIESDFSALVMEIHKRKQ